jgi:hypothetical protein
MPFFAISVSANSIVSRETTQDDFLRGRYRIEAGLELWLCIMT